MVSKKRKKKGLPTVFSWSPYHWILVSWIEMRESICGPGRASLKKHLSSTSKWYSSAIYAANSTGFPEPSSCSCPNLGKKNKKNSSTGRFGHETTDSTCFEIISAEEAANPVTTSRKACMDNPVPNPSRGLLRPAAHYGVLSWWQARRKDCGTFLSSLSPWIHLSSIGSLSFRSTYRSFSPAHLLLAI